MTTIIRRTNPDHDPKRRTDPWKCAACGQHYLEEDEARQCAVRDHEAKAAEAAGGAR